jgi:hypothetical protein
LEDDADLVIELFYRLCFFFLPLSLLRFLERSTDALLDLLVADIDSDPSLLLLMRLFLP